jgi:hypothetical protein
MNTAANSASWAQIVDTALQGASWPRLRKVWPRPVGLPYCLHATDDPNVRCVVNRQYKPLGVSAPEWVDYGAARNCHVAADVFNALHTAGVVDERGYFFRDGTEPWYSSEAFDVYFDKMDRLLSTAERRDMDTAKVARIKAKLLAYIREHKSGLSFINLKDAASEDAEGPYDLSHARFRNIVYWAYLSLEFTEAITQLEREEVIEYVPTLPLVYMVDGRVLSLPIAKRVRAYKKPHWLPVCVRLAGKPGASLED